MKLKKDLQGHLILLYLKSVKNINRFYYINKSDFFYQNIVQRVDKYDIITICYILTMLQQQK